MAKPEGMKQITMYVPDDLLEKADEAAYQMRQRRNDRTSWIIKAMEEKLERDAALMAEISEAGDAARVKEIVSAYNAINETGKEWLHITAVIARGADDFK